MIRSSKMFRAIFAVFALLAVASTELDFINKCSLSDPYLEQCFVKNGNLAIEQLSSGIEDLYIPSLGGFDLGDLNFEVINNLFLVLKDSKVYPQGVSLNSVSPTFGSEKDLQELEVSIEIDNAIWQAKYRALGSNRSKIDETGSTEINLGSMWVDFTLYFERMEVAGEYYLRVYDHKRGDIRHEKFQFIPKDVYAPGKKLKPEDFQPWAHEFTEKLQDLGFTQHVVYVFNQVLQEIPEKEIFLP